MYSNSDYNIFIISLINVRMYFNSVIKEIADQYNYEDYNHEEIYDWVVTEAFRKLYIKENIEIINHYSHDIRRCVFSEIGYDITQLLNISLFNSKISFNVNEKVKITVVGNSLIIAKKIYF